ncbi:MAG TPA: alpha/beta fold hydrolase [Blastocatellia bacterium]|nr:alpha/beta fold hydrolase [Blastocatellia bacterium]
MKLLLTLTTIILILCPSREAASVRRSGAAPRPSSALAERQKRAVDFKSPDGVTLRGTLYTPGKPGPGIILFHMCDGKGRGAWDNLAAQLAQAGFYVLTYDYRGVGESEGERFQGGSMQQVLHYWRTKWGGDAESALGFLLAQPGVNKKDIGAGGASCGVYMSLLLAQQHPAQVKTLVLLGGPIDAGTKSFVENSEELTLLGVTSEEDVRSTQWTREIIGASKNPATRLILYQNAGHGTQMLENVKELRPLIVDWFTIRLRPGN